MAGTDDFNESDEQVIAPLIQSSESVDGAIKAVFEDGREDECIKHLKCRLLGSC